jgi:hypothetical protein
LNPGEEIYRGFIDHAGFCRESLSVQNKLGHLVAMEEGPAQKKLTAIVKRCQEKRKPVRVIVPKARQVWISVGVASHFFHGTPFLAGQHTLILANDEKTALNLFSHYQRFHDNYRPFGDVIKLPEVVKNNSTEIEWANESWIQCHTTRALTIGRSFTLRRVHFSEAAYYVDLKTTMAAVMAAVPDDPDTMVIVESTANGVGNEFHRMCLAAAEGNSEWELLFFGWWEHPEYTRPLRDPGGFQSTLTGEEREMMRQYNLTLEQLHWRRWCIANKLGGDATLFKQEYPSNFEEAFLSSGRPRFSHAAINRMPLVHDGLVGGLEEQLYAGSKRIVFLPREHGELKIFRKPDPAKTYVIGTDTCEGIDANEGKGEADPDWGVSVVRERETGDQAATLRARMEPAEHGRYLALLGRYYNMACQVPEVNNTGISTLDALLQADYPPGLIYHRMTGQADDDPKERPDKIGWKTTVVTRPQLISWYDEAIRTLSIYIRDPIVAQEARTFVVKPNGRSEHQKSCHDDCVIADALTVVGIMHMPKPKAPIDIARPVVTKYGQAVESDSRGTRVRLR